MSVFFDPQKVSVRDIKKWLIETQSLFFRRPFLFVFLSLGYFCISYCSTKILGEISVLFGLVLFQINLSLFVIISWSVDKSESILISKLFTNFKSYIYYLVLLSLLYLLIFISLIMAVQYFGSETSKVVYYESELFDLLKWLLVGTFEFYISYFGILVTLQWFLNPLLSLYDIELKDSIYLSAQAIIINYPVMFIASAIPFMAFELLRVTTELNLVLSVILFPFFGIFQYVSFRHIFLGKIENDSVVMLKDKPVLLIQN